VSVVIYKIVMEVSVGTEFWCLLSLWTSLVSYNLSMFSREQTNNAGVRTFTISYIYQKDSCFYF